MAEHVAEAKPIRIAVVGVSEGRVCGVRDYAAVLTEGIRRLAPRLAPAARTVSRRLAALEKRAAARPG